MENKKTHWFCSCEKEAELDICDKCRERVNTPGYDDIFKNHFREKSRKVAEAEKHFGQIEGCEPLLSHAIDDTEFDIIDKAIQLGEIPPIIKSRNIRLGALSIGLRPKRKNASKRIIIDIDPECPYVLVRCIINEISLDTLQDTPAESQ